MAAVSARPALLSRRCLPQSSCNSCQFLQHPPFRSFTASASARAGASSKDTSQDASDADALTQRVRPPKKPTSHRKRMYSFLNGIGRSFQEPQGYPVYLGAYKGTGSRRHRDPEEEEDGVIYSKGKPIKLVPQEYETGGAGRKPEKDAKGDEEGGERESNRLRLKPTTMIGSDAMPFPLNPEFRSEAVLSEVMRQEIWRRVVKGQESISAVSAALHVDMRRVAAVVRLKKVEMQWKTQGLPLAEEYSLAVLQMLPQTGLARDPKQQPKHESINDLPVHAHTGQQIFWPTAESRRFTREDAAAVFDADLLPADDRIPHPELIQKISDEEIDQYMDYNEVQNRDDEKVRERVERALAQTRAEEEREQRASIDQQESQEREALAKSKIKVVQAKRVNFRFEAINVDDVGKDGRSEKGTGWRYGVPLGDRKRGHLKGVPTAVEV